MCYSEGNKEIRMARKKYVSANTKYYKNSQVGGVVGHVNRLFAENKNAFDEYTYLNFGDSNLTERYRELHRRKEEQTGKKSRKDATTYCETVLAFSLEQYEHIEAAAFKKAGGDPVKAQKMIEKVFSECLRDYQEQIKERFGLTPVGFNMHLDEGHIDKTTGELKRNIHAHAGFYNYDFEKGVSPWRKMGKKQLSEMQDIADRCFSKLGYERGIKATETNKRHQEKDEFIESKRLEQLAQLEQEQKELDELREQKRQEQKELDLMQSKIKEIQDNRDQLLDDYKQQASQPNKTLQRFLYYAFDYLKALLNGSSRQEKKERYEKSKDDLKGFEFSNEETLMINNTKALIEEEENPKKQLENILKESLSDGIE